MNSDTRYILVLSDEHLGPGKQFGLKGERSKFTTFGGKSAEGYANLLESGVSIAISAGDRFNVNLPGQRSLNISDAADIGVEFSRDTPLHEQLDALRDYPELYLEHLVSNTPSVQHYEVVANHSGMCADDSKLLAYLKRLYAPVDAGNEEQEQQAVYDIEHDGHRKYIDTLHRLVHEYDNFSFSDAVQIGNLCVKHGHDDVEFYPRGCEVDGNSVYGASYVVKQGTKTRIVPADNPLSLAEQILGIRHIKAFVHQNISNLPPSTHTNLFILMGHTHKHWDAQIDMILDDNGEPQFIVPQRISPKRLHKKQDHLFIPDEKDPRPKVTIHLSNLGCFLPGRAANAKLLRLEDGMVTAMIGIGNMARFADPKVREIGLEQYLEQCRVNGKYPAYINGKGNDGHGVSA